jgi:hypothetical protein
LPWQVPQIKNALPEGLAMFGFYSNRLGCLGSIAVSIVGTVVLLLVMRGCAAG